MSNTTLTPRTELISWIARLLESEVPHVDVCAVKLTDPLTDFRGTCYGVTVATATQMYRCHVIVPLDGKVTSASVATELTLLLEQIKGGEA